MLQKMLLIGCWKTLKVDKRSSVDFGAQTVLVLSVGCFSKELQLMLMQRGPSRGLLFIRIAISFIPIICVNSIDLNGIELFRARGWRILFSTKRGAAVLWDVEINGHCIEFNSKLWDRCSGSKWHNPLFNYFPQCKTKSTVRAVLSKRRI